jgi:glycerol-3-phosphate cytidylyltransferase
MGHLSLFKSMRKRCGRLIAGVFETADTVVFPEIPLQERVEILKAVRYIDEVVTLEKSGEYIKNTWNTYRYDCFITADDSAGDPYTLEAQAWLRKRGADLVFIPFAAGQDEEGLKNRAGGRKVLAFGAGKWFDRYMNGKGKLYPPAFVFDNNPEMWGTKKHGIPVKPPDELPELVRRGGRILITCAKPDEIKAQLNGMGITECYIPR